MKALTANELRKLYIDFFVSKGHKQISGASLIPENDPTVLFTTAGMHPLVPYLLILGVLAMLLAESHRAWAALPALTPFVAVAGVTLSPVFLDPASLLPWLAPVLDWLPTTLYLRGSQGDGCALTTMLLLSFLLGIPAFFSLPNGMGFLR